MYTLFLTALILSAEPNQPTEIIGSAAMPDGEQHNVEVTQPDNLENPFGYIAPPPEGQPTVTAPPADILLQNTSTSETTQAIGQPTVNQAETINPTDINPLDYENKIGNTLYQQGNRLIDVQSVPVNEVGDALIPNIQPTVTDVPEF